MDKLFESYELAFYNGQRSARGKLVGLYYGRKYYYTIV